MGAAGLRCGSHSGGDLAVNEFRTVCDVAKALAVSASTVTRMCVAGQLPAYRIGRQWRIDQTDFVRWLRARRSGQWRQFTSVEMSGGCDTATRDFY